MVKIIKASVRKFLRDDITKRLQMVEDLMNKTEPHDYRLHLTNSETCGVDKVFKGLDPEAVEEFMKVIDKYYTEAGYRVDIAKYTNDRYSSSITIMWSN